MAYRDARFEMEICTQRNRGFRSAVDKAEAARGRLAKPLTGKSIDPRLMGDRRWRDRLQRDGQTPTASGYAVRPHCTPHDIFLKNLVDRLR